MRFLASLFILGLLVSCDPGKKQSLTLFTNLSEEETGIDFRNDLNEDHFNLMDYMYFYNGGGVAIGDVNNDGLKDVLFTANQKSNKLYLNKGNFEFTDVTEAAGLNGIEGWTTGVTMADVNGDGLLDIYVCQLGNYLHIKGKNQLYINNGDLTFTDRAEEYGLDFSGYSTQALFFDYDNDNDLDMYLLNHALHTDRAYRESSSRKNVDLLSGDRLYRNELNEGVMQFKDITLEAGIYSSQLGYGLGISAGDINFDGWVDLYVSNDFHENDYLYLNQGDGKFSENLENSMGHSSRYSMGNDMADVNNDGLLDVITLDMLPKDEEILKKSVGEDSYEVYEIKLNKGYHHQLVRNTLQLNLGNEKFSDIALLTGIYATDWSWAPLVCDLDNDGLKDIYITNGIYKRPNDLDYVNYHSNNSQQLYRDYSQDSVDRFLLQMMPTLKITNYAFSVSTDYTYEDMTSKWGLDIPTYSNGAAYADLDNDGDLDLVVNNINDKAQILRNNSDSLSSNNYIKIRLKGAGKNIFGIGAKILLYDDANTQYQENMPTRGFMSSVDPELNFGLGQSSEIDSIKVIWPDRRFQTVKAPALNSTIEFDYNNASGTFDFSPKSSGSTYFEEQEGRLTFTHRENSFVDFNREYLMPHKLSTEGPLIAKGDINGDGKEDIILGGAAAQPTKCFIQKSNGVFELEEQDVFIEDRFSEDVGIVLFDMEGDGDLDLYIVSGGNEFKSGMSVMQDRLYENDGKGNFLKTSNLPNLTFNGSCVRPFDFDRDGDIDLFVGARSIPGEYGTKPASTLLENDGTGKYQSRSVKSLESLGMVTDAVWGDFNNDEWTDLAIVGEWMPLTFLYGNSKNDFDLSAVDYTEGWWNTLSSFDYDNDGDLDLIGGNLGLNSKIKASTEEPASLYIKDFDNDGKLDQVLCFYKNGKSVPFASRDELIKQMASLKKKFVSYEDFSKVGSIEDLVGKKNMKDVRVLNAYLFESSVFENLGNSKFKIHKLPVETQFSPVHSILPIDLDKDGFEDLIMAGNFGGAIINRGKYDAGYGSVVLNSGSGNFTALKESIGIDGDVRDMVTVKTENGSYLIVSKNNHEAQVFKINNPLL